MTISTTHTHILYPHLGQMGKYFGSTELFSINQSELPLSEFDRKLIFKATDFVIHHLENQSFNAVDFADEMCMSRVHLYRKLKTLTGESISGFVNTIRLKVAVKLLRETDMSIKQVAYTVGFSDPKYFSRCFKKKFGYQPSKMK